MEDGTFHTAVSFWHYYHNDGGSSPFPVESPTRGFLYKKISIIQLFKDAFPAKALCMVCGRNARNV